MTDELESNTSGAAQHAPEAAAESARGSAAAPPASVEEGGQDAAPAVTEVAASSAAGRELLTRAPDLDAAPETAPTDLEWLNAHAGDLINFMMLARPKSDTYPDIDDIRGAFIRMPDDELAELRVALELYLGAAAQIPAWLLSGLVKLARAAFYAQGIDWTGLP